MCNFAKHLEKHFKTAAQSEKLLEEAVELLRRWNRRDGVLAKDYFKMMDDTDRWLRDNNFTEQQTSEKAGVDEG